MNVIVSLQLTGFGIAIQANVDPNPENFICAGIIKVKLAQIGCLLRLEPNRQAQVNIVLYCLLVVLSLYCHGNWNHTYCGTVPAVTNISLVIAGFFKLLLAGFYYLSTKKKCSATKLLNRF
jgi:hypothetical protein